MSRIGKAPITVPGGVDVTIDGAATSRSRAQGHARRATSPAPSPSARTATQLAASSARTTSARPAPCTGSPARWSTTWSSASPTASPRSSRSSASATAPRPRARPAAPRASASATRSIVEAPEGITFEVPGPDTRHRARHRQGSRRPGGRQHPRDPQARAVQGQGRPLRRRESPAQGRQDRKEVSGAS